MTEQVEMLVKGDQVIEKVGGKIVSQKDYNRGYHATLKRAGTSTEKKEHAQMMIRELEISHAKSVAGAAPPGQTVEGTNEEKKSVEKGGGGAMGVGQQGEGRDNGAMREQYDA